MADLRRSVRDLFLQGVEAVNNAANHVASATRTKVDELNLRNRRKELLDTLAAAVYEQWQQGLELPDALKETLEQIRGIDEQLQEMEKQQEKAEPAASAEAASAPSIVVDEEEKAPAEPEKPVASEIPTIQVDEPETPASEE